LIVSKEKKSFHKATCIVIAATLFPRQLQQTKLPVKKDTKRILNRYESADKI
jgi:hypothetical protein